MRVVNNGTAVEIYFSDLSEKAKKEFLEFMGTDEKEENWEVFSLTVIPK